MLQRSVFSLLILSGVAIAQPFGAGLKLGAPTTDAFNLQSAVSNFDAQRFTVGPYVELRLPGALALELDALYRHYDFGPQAAHSWEFPLLLKHRILPGPIKPFFEGGISFLHLSDIPNFSVNHFSNYGLVAGGGVELHLFSTRIAPEIRYNGWAFRNFDNSTIQSNRNQLTFLVGIGF